MKCFSIISIEDEHNSQRAVLVIGFVYIPIETINWKN